MAIAGPAAPQAPTPPAVPGLAGASEAVGGLPDFGVSGQAAIEGAQERAAAAAQAGQDAAANARAAGERLMGTPERRTTSEGAGEESGAEGKLAQTPANAAPEAGGARSQVAASEAAQLPPAAQAQQAATGSETRTAAAPPAEEPQGFGMLHLALVAIFCAIAAGILAYKLLHRKKGEPTPAMRAAREAELLAELEESRAARERREAERAAAVAAAGLSAIAGDWTRAAKEESTAHAGEAMPPMAAAGARSADGQARTASSKASGGTQGGSLAAGAPTSPDAASDASTLASLSQALAAFREASRILDDDAGDDANVTAAEEARKATRIAALRQDGEKDKSEHGNFEIRI